MKRGDVEKLAKEVRERAGYELDDVPLATVIAERVVGHPVQLVADLPSAASLRLGEDGHVVYVRQGEADLRFKVLHEIGHYAIRELAQLSLPFETEERAASQIAGAILAPRVTLDRARNYYGERLRPLARTFGMTQTALVLRIGEAYDETRAVVTSKNRNVMTRSPTDFQWPSDLAVIAHAGSPTPGLVKVRLRGGLDGIDDGRIAIRIAAEKK